MSDAILKRGVKPFDIVVKGESKYVVKEPMNDRDCWFLVRDEHAQKMDYSTITMTSFEELVDNYKFDWEVPNE